jgi:hypothetical protein
LDRDNPSAKENSMTYKPLLDKLHFNATEIANELRPYERKEMFIAGLVLDLATQLNLKIDFIINELNYLTKVKKGH